LTVGPREALAGTGIETGEPTWCSGAPELPTSVQVQIRAHGRPVPAEVFQTETGLQLRLAEAESGVAPGQAAAMYLGDRVLGAARIKRTTNDLATSA
jgi:tRNA-uridine 2-sulfurtransferase